ncbi:MAG: DoxX family protein [Gemmatimonadales bacterium]
MPQLSPYAAVFLRLAVGGVFLNHGLVRVRNGVPAVAGFLRDLGFPFAPVWAVVLIAVETVGAVCVMAGVLTRVWAACMAVVMVVAILAVRLRSGASFELEAMLLAGA